MCFIEHVVLYKISACVILLRRKCPVFLIKTLNFYRAWHFFSAEYYTVLVFPITTYRCDPSLRKNAIEEK